MPSNTPIADAELAEVKRLVAAATGGKWCEFAGSLTIEVDGHVVEEIAQFTSYNRGNNGRAIAALHNAFGPIIARLEAAEREQQRVHELANRLLDANNGLIDTIRKLDPEALCDWHDSIGGDEYLQRWLAARDAQQRRDGAAEVWDQISKITAHVTDGFIRVSKGYAEEQAESLREGGE